ncbi:hypothetical protein PR202_gb15228 [Eleusine coracana subsp. coracana]|uniref:Uncharacterized protein n=1 Tax=Eleusine coracana subsp. coracana TaxID=191504 RepID=A0AAV5EWK9_ELECO|nr:hypothetical protein PR202_gb15228 [Eleusine coracana subsp. coracana]
MYDTRYSGSKNTDIVYACKYFQVLNQIVYELPVDHPLAETKPLREILGHTVPQVRSKSSDTFLDVLIFVYCKFRPYKVNKQNR